MAWRAVLMQWSLSLKRFSVWGEITCQPYAVAVLDVQVSEIYGI